jgi:hypothetical protein
MFSLFLRQKRNDKNHKHLKTLSNNEMSNEQNKNSKRKMDINNFGS